MNTTLFTSIAAAILATAPAQAETPSTETATEEGAAEAVGLDPARFERLTVPVTIDGQGPYRFFINTGAQATVISTAIADQLAMVQRDSAILVGMASRRPIETVMIENFGVGRRSIPLPVAPLVTPENLAGADGVLGLDTLQDHRVMLDFARDEFFIVPTEERYRRSDYEIIVEAQRMLGQLIITDAMIDGIKVAVIVDTGAQSSIGNRALERRLRGRERGETQLTDINGVKMAGDVVMAKRLEFGRASINHVPIMIGDPPPFEVLGLADRPALVLGMSELRLFDRVAIDFGRRRVLFDLPADAYRNRPSRGTFGYLSRR